jgi:hypothetical protein
MPAKALPGNPPRGSAPLYESVGTLMDLQGSFLLDQTKFPDKAELCS